MKSQDKFGRQYLRWNSNNDQNNCHYEWHREDYKNHEVDNNKNPQEFYVSMTDGKYGFKETLEANINSDIVTTYPELESISDYCKVIK